MGRRTGTLWLLSMYAVAALGVACVPFRYAPPPPPPPPPSPSAPAASSSGAGATPRPAVATTAATTAPSTGATAAATAPPAGTTAAATTAPTAAATSTAAATATPASTAAPAATATPSAAAVTTSVGWIHPANAAEATSLGIAPPYLSLGVACATGLPPGASVQLRLGGDAGPPATASGTVSANGRLEVRFGIQRAASVSFEFASITPTSGAAPSPLPAGASGTVTLPASKPC